MQYQKPLRRAPAATTWDPRSMQLDAFLTPDQARVYWMSSKTAPLGLGSRRGFIVCVLEIKDVSFLTTYLEKIPPTVFSLICKY